MIVDKTRVRANFSELARYAIEHFSSAYINDDSGLKSDQGHDRSVFGKDFDNL
jgi:hypothetical protein